MRVCRCGGLFTRPGKGDLCPVCSARESRRVYVDGPDWLARQYARLDAAKALNKMSPELPISQGINGICPVCKKAIDDHGLTHTAEPYPVALCNPPARPTPPPLPEQTTFDDDSMMG